MGKKPKTMSIGWTADRPAATKQRGQNETDRRQAEKGHRDTRHEEAVGKRPHQDAADDRRGSDGMEAGAQVPRAGRRDAQAPPLRPFACRGDPRPGPGLPGRGPGRGRLPDARGQRPRGRARGPERARDPLRRPPDQKQPLAGLIRLPGIVWDRDLGPVLGRVEDDRADVDRRDAVEVVDPARVAARPPCSTDGCMRRLDGDRQNSTFRSASARLPRMSDSMRSAGGASSGAVTNAARASA